VSDGMEGQEECGQDGRRDEDRRRKDQKRSGEKRRGKEEEADLLAVIMKGWIDAHDGGGS
jgi:hypothetical protein